MPGGRPHVDGRLYRLHLGRGGTRRGVACCALGERRLAQPQCRQQAGTGRRSDWAAGRSHRDRGLPPPPPPGPAPASVAASPPQPLPCMAAVPGAKVGDQAGAAAGCQLADAAAEDAAHEPVHPAWVGGVVEPRGRGPGASKDPHKREAQRRANRFDVQRGQAQGSARREPSCSSPCRPGARTASSKRGRACTSSELRPPKRGPPPSQSAFISDL